MASLNRPDDRVLVLAPSGRDAALASEALAHGTIEHEICRDLDELCRAIAEGAGAALIASEALAGDRIERLRRVLTTQAPWSDLPLIVLTPASESPERNRRTLEVLSRLGNVTTLERPVHALGMIAALRAALRARRRQYATRDLLRQLEDALEQRERFLAVLGHELRNPLGAIRNSVEIAQRSFPPEPKFRRPMGMIERQSDLLHRLVDDLLDVSRVTSGKIVLQREVVDMNAVAREAAEQLEGRFDAQGVALTVYPFPEPVSVSGDPARLGQIIANLLANAAKYTPQGGSVSLRVQRDASNAVVRVDDTGIGIAPELLSHIFDLFAQADESLERSRGGLGIGLTLAKTLAELHGGTLEAASEGHGRGSTFTLRLPGAPASAQSVVPQPAPAPAADRAFRVLVVEDNEDNRESLRELLELSGHDVHVASDGPEGLARAIEVRPDIAMVDVGLPHWSGYELARRIRVAVGRDIYLIALTGYGLPEDRRRALEAGFDAHVTKPFDIAELERLINATASTDRPRAPDAARV